MIKHTTQRDVDLPVIADMLGTDALSAVSADGVTTITCTDARIDPKALEVAVRDHVARPPTPDLADVVALVDGIIDTLLGSTVAPMLGQRVLERYATSTQAAPVEQLDAALAKGWILPEEHAAAVADEGGRDTKGNPPDSGRE